MIGLFQTVLLCLLQLVAVHDAPIALFRLSPDVGAITIEVRCDLEDYCNAYQISSEDLTKVHIETTLTKHTDWVINGQASQLDDFEIKFDGEHIHINVKASIGSIASVVDLSIYNNFMNAIPNHSNIIQASLNEKARDFRMNKDRKEIQISY